MNITSTASLTGRTAPAQLLTLFDPNNLGDDVIRVRFADRERYLVETGQATPEQIEAEHRAYDFATPYLQPMPIESSGLEAPLEPEQLSLFDAEELDPVSVDPFAEWSLTDIRALALDPDPEVRIEAAASHWNWDDRLQRVVASDPDERVVLALLDQIDPSVEAAMLIIYGPHIGARRELATRNLPSDLLLRLTDDSDPIARESARRTLVGRGVQVSPAEFDVDEFHIMAVDFDGTAGNLAACASVQP